MPASLDTVAALKAHLNRVDDFMEHIRLAKSITPDAAMHAVFDHLLDEEAEHREAVSDALSNAPQEHLTTDSAIQNKKALSKAPAEHHEAVNDALTNASQEAEIISPLLPVPAPLTHPVKTPLTVGSLYGQGQ
jgi:hypothetical protein